MKDGTPADASAASLISDAELKKLKHDVVIQRVITKAAYTMPPEQCDEFVVALCDPKPPRWAKATCDRIWSQIKQEQNACSAARAA